MSMTTLLQKPFKKPLRRSARIIKRNKEINVVCEGPLGLFEVLSVEILHTIFGYLSVEQLSVFAITSKQMRNHVLDYVNSPKGNNAVIPSKERLRTYRQTEPTVGLFRYAKLGLLMKRATCLFPTNLRLSMILNYTSKVANLKGMSYDDSSYALKCFGTLLHTVISGWEESECISVHNALEKHGQLRDIVHGVLINSPGSLPELEMHLRLYYRQLYFDNTTVNATPNSTPDAGFWLCCILKPWPIVCQARLLYILFGPASSEGIQWWQLTEIGPSIHMETHKAVHSLANALRVLNKYCEWPLSSTMALFQELIEIPTHWLVDKVANLLFLCGEDIAAPILGNKLINGRIDEIANIISFLAVVCTRYQMPLKWLVNLVEKVFSVSSIQEDKRNFISLVPESFFEKLLILHDASSFDEEHESDFGVMLEAQRNFLSAVMAKAFAISEARPTSRSTPAEE